MNQLLRAAVAAGVMTLFGETGFAQHLDVKLSTSNGPVAGSKLVLDVYGDLNWYVNQAGGLPVDHDTGLLIFPANFNDFDGGPYSTDNPGFQTFAGQFLPHEELHFRALEHLWYLPVGGTQWQSAPSGGGIRLYGSIPDDVAFDYSYYGVREAEYLYYAGGTLFSGDGITGPVTAPITAASGLGGMHYHLDWDLEGAAQAAKGTYLLKMSLFSSAQVGGSDKYMPSDPFYIIFRNDVTDGQFAIALKTMTVPAPVPEPSTWALFAGGIGLATLFGRRRLRTSPSDRLPDGVQPPA
ncbi:MAG: PEP-CTERM sorting domain-containing protein [Betaproteobacteria bacterium]|nr:PEP-CTERM sorting domain-containing protein [Betaproteobacteria bacterium]